MSFKGVCQIIQDTVIRLLPRAKRNIIMSKASRQSCRLLAIPDPLLKFMYAKIYIIRLYQATFLTYLHIFSEMLRKKQNKTRTSFEVYKDILDLDLTILHIFIKTFIMIPITHWHNFFMQCVNKIEE